MDVADGRRESWFGRVLCRFDRRQAVLVEGCWVRPCTRYVAETNSNGIVTRPSRRDGSRCVSLAVACHDLRRKHGGGDRGRIGARRTGMGTGMGMGMGMGGMGLMPMMSAMNPTASLSPTDAAALGMPAPNNGGMGMNGMNGVFMNPMAAPYLLGYADVEQPDRRDDA